MIAQSEPTTIPFPTQQAGRRDQPFSGQILIDPRRSGPRSFNCDACAASLPAPTRLSPSLGQVLQVHAQLAISDLGGGNLAVYSPLSQVGVVVLSEPMRALLDAFSEPATMADARHQLSGLTDPEFEQAVRIMTRCGILCEPVA